MKLDEKAVEKLDRLLAQFHPVRQPDSFFMTDTTRAKIEEALKPTLVAKAAQPGTRYAGIDIYCYPAGTVVINMKTGERATIDENTVLSVIRSDCRIVEPPSAMLAAAGGRDE